MSSLTLHTFEERRTTARIMRRTHTSHSNTRRLLSGLSLLETMGNIPQSKMYERISYRSSKRLRERLKNLLILSFRRSGACIRLIARRSSPTQPDMVNLLEHIGSVRNVELRKGDDMVVDPCNVVPRLCRIQRRS